jgi:hypothetical protein
MSAFDNNSQTSSGQSANAGPARAPVAGQADTSASYHNDGTKTVDTRTSEEKAAAAKANRAAQAEHALPKIEQCKPVSGQANPNASFGGGK